MSVLYITRPDMYTGKIEWAVGDGPPDSYSSPVDLESKNALEGAVLRARLVVGEASYNTPYWLIGRAQHKFLDIRSYAAGFFAWEEVPSLEDICRALKIVHNIVVASPQNAGGSVHLIRNLYTQILDLGLYTMRVPVG